MRAFKSLTRAATASAFVLALIAWQQPASAIANGVPDGDTHPNVGAYIVEVPGHDRLYHGCSGFLVHERVFVTAGHCVYNMLRNIQRGFRYGVTFRPDEHELFFSSLDDGIASGDIIEVVDLFLDFNARLGKGGTDYGALVLAEPVTDIVPVELAPLGFLDERRKSRELRHGSKLTVVGYGVEFVMAPPPTYFPPGTRMTARAGYLALTPSWLHLNEVQALDNGGSCFGDSGGPAFWTDPDTSMETVVALVSTGDMICVAHEVHNRLDVPEAEAFLDHVIGCVEYGCPE
jgi:hypothetical protein